MFNLLGHAKTSVAESQKRALGFDRNIDVDSPTVRHGVDSVEDQIGQDFTQRSFFADDDGIGAEGGSYFDINSIRLCLRLPLWLG